MALGCGFVAVLLLAYFVTRVLEESATDPYQRSDSAWLSGATTPAAARAPTQLLTMHEDGAAGQFRPADLGVLHAWTEFLLAQPAWRVTLTRADAPTGDRVLDHRRLAAVARLLAAGGVNPHRIRIELGPANTEAAPATPGAVVQIELKASPE